MKLIKWDKIKEKEKVHNTVSKLYNKRFENYYDEYNTLSDVKKISAKKCKPKNLKLEDYDYDGWFTEEELHNEERLDDMPPLEGDKEEAKEGKGLKILTLNKSLTRLPILLAQIKARKN